MNSIASVGYAAAASEPSLPSWFAAHQVAPMATTAAIAAPRANRVLSFIAFSFFTHQLIDRVGILCLHVLLSEVGDESGINSFVNVVASNVSALSLPRSRM